ncbi:MAG: tetratricopeptide repeat protein [Chryseolinea sp.]
MRSTILTSAMVIFLAFQTGRAFSQCKEFKWKEDSALTQDARANFQRFDNAVQGLAFQNAASALTWLLINVPNVGSDMYPKGTLAFDKLAEREKDKRHRRILIDSMFLLYDLHLKACGPSTRVSDAKAMAVYKYYSPSDPKRVLHMFDSLLKVRGNSTSDAMIIAYMQTVKKVFLKYNKLTDDEMLTHYNRAMKIAEAKQRDARRKGQSQQEFLLLKDNIDAILFSIVVIDCAFVKQNLGPRFRRNPRDLVLAKKIVSFMLQNQCIEDPLWLQAGERLYKSDTVKDYSLARTLGLRYFGTNNFTKAQPMLEDALARAPGDKEKVEMLLYLGRVRAKTNKSEARKMFVEALTLEKGNKEAYERIGDLYFDSGVDCGKNENPVDDLLVYVLAASYYQQSGNDKKVSLARGKFPTKADLSQVGYDNGSQKLVGCWIQEMTTLRTKD